MATASTPMLAMTCIHTGSVSIMLELSGRPIAMYPLSYSCLGCRQESVVDVEQEEKRIDHDCHRRRPGEHRPEHELEPDEAAQQAREQAHMRAPPEARERAVDGQSQHPHATDRKADITDHV